MSRAQREACAAKLPPAAAEQFLALLDEAAALFNASAEARREAWKLYRSFVPNAAPKKGDKA
jgi:hypothetical protein